MITRDYTIYYNGKSALDYGLVVEHRPTIPSAEPVVTEFEVPARDGVLHRSEGTVNDVEMTVSFAFVVDRPDNWMKVYRNALSWLYSDGDKKLYLSEDLDWFYKVVSVSVSDEPERINWYGGRFEATFAIKGYGYMASGELPQTNYLNPFDISHPMYRLTGNSNVTLNVNGKTATVNIGQEVVIDTDLMIAYRPSDGAVRNTSISGDYEDLWLKPGKNTVTLSGSTSGVTLYVYPRWRKRL